MAPGAATMKVEKSKVVMYGDVHPHQLIPFGVKMYGGFGPVKVTNEGEDEDEEAALGSLHGMEGEVDQVAVVIALAARGRRGHSQRAQHHITDGPRGAAQQEAVGAGMVEGV
ncbi:hypothetical protein CYMTET_7958 [Cymbomonas tetramitiformis]|uniref:Uncharacterized protein n=1 Tax=Cymbomonas tetramitiformis TaxID=36881 RepID=A0AAE0LGK0_9CHLO|nr:hypothetical protein CYMTET_7958 [Cymbomonas tetramitiformis]